MRVTWLSSSLTRLVGCRWRLRTGYLHATLPVREALGPQLAEQDNPIPRRFWAPALQEHTMGIDGLRPLDDAAINQCLPWQ